MLQIRRKFLRNNFFSRLLVKEKEARSSMLALKFPKHQSRYLKRNPTESNRVK